ncbi:MAG: MarR family transcriptional regulator [Candidatus Acidiferrum sp.]|jgi:DNA-binding MarR family transcriptional regulator
MSDKHSSKKPTIQELADQLHSVAIHLLRLVRVQDAGSGIAPARLSALSVIVFGGPVSLRDLAKAEQVRPPTMSRIVDALEAQGLARRRVDEKDRRGVVIAATQKGVTMLKQGRQRRVKFLASHLSRLQREERAHIAQAVRAMQRVLRPR